MDGERRSRIAAMFAPGDGMANNATLCERSVAVLHVQGAGVSIMSGTNSGPVCSSSERVRRLEDLQFSLGEGPCHDAFVTRSMVAEPDLAKGTNINWSNYTPAALDLGACAVFAFPLLIGAGVIGALTVYNDTIGVLANEQAADAHELAQMLPAIMSAIQAQAAQSLLAGDLSDANAHRTEVHQASGMTAIQLGIDVAQSLVRIRAYAYANNQTVAHVAGEILAHRLKLGNDGLDKRERLDE